ncbi:MAG: hypothetical protein H6765_02520 [Candidatus Peribacteria bacterium]|nr:MAG: hypothetical protein H6765_02520 [Candidatus Peribacteria bacterium]
MSAFNYKNTRLTSYESEATGKTKTYIAQYFDDCVFNGYKGRPDRSSDPGDGQSPFYQE